jgi:hypothetical protein
MPGSHDRDPCPANSIRGAAALTGMSDGHVIDCRRHDDPMSA